MPDLDQILYAHVLYKQFLNKWNKLRTLVALTYFITSFSLLFSYSSQHNTTSRIFSTVILFCLFMNQSQRDF